MSADQPFMLLIERYQVEPLLNALMLLREKDIEEMGSSDHRVDVMLYNVVTHAGIPWTKATVPEAYKLVFPEEPPKGQVTYGASTK